jgi:hypothetical protein
LAASGLRSRFAAAGREAGNGNARGKTEGKTEWTPNVGSGMRQAGTPKNFNRDLQKALITANTKFYAFAGPLSDNDQIYTDVFK